MKALLIALLISSATFFISSFSYSSDDLNEIKSERLYDKVVRVPIGTKVTININNPSRLVDSQVADLGFELIARFQHYNSKPDHPDDHYDEQIYSPKSVHFSSYSGKVYINSLEGVSTIVYDPVLLRKESTIIHRFNSKNSFLFSDDILTLWSSFPDDISILSPNNFKGKPVEFAETHNGKYLWISYYRRDFDLNGSLPSAVAIVDTDIDRIVKVMSTGSVPKMLAASADGRWLAVIHWGDNTVGLIDVSGNSPSTFHRAGLIKVGKKIKLDMDEKVNRDKECGFCLRGAVFSADSRYLFVGRMRGGGIAVIDVVKQLYIGTIFGMKPTPRHLVLSKDGNLLYFSSNVSGYVSSYRTDDLINAALNGIRTLKPVQEVHTGSGARTIVISPDGSLLFATVNKKSKIAVIDISSMKVLLYIPTDSFPVGLDVAPDGSQLWVTSQGRNGEGGNSVTVYSVLNPEYVREQNVQPTASTD